MMRPVTAGRAYLLVDCSTGFFTGTIQTLGQLKQQEYLMSLPKDS